MKKDWIFNRVPRRVIDRLSYWEGNRVHFESKWIASRATLIRVGWVDDAYKALVAEHDGRPISESGLDEIVRTYLAAETLRCYEVGYGVYDEVDEVMLSPFVDQEGGVVWFDEACLAFVDLVLACGIQDVYFSVPDLDRDPDQPESPMLVKADEFLIAVVCNHAPPACSFDTGGLRSAVKQKMGEIYGKVKTC